MIIYKCDENPKKCAQALDDRTLNISVMMAAQALSSACFILGIWTKVMYRPQHTDHPVPQWAALTRNNFIWLYRFGQACSEEYKRRYQVRQPHASAIVIDVCWITFKANPLRPLKKVLMPFPNITEFQFLKPIHAYRKELCEREWKSKVTWTGTHAPAWYYTLLQKKV